MQYFLLFSLQFLYYELQYSLIVFYLGYTCFQFTFIIIFKLIRSSMFGEFDYGQGISFNQQLNNFKERRKPFTYSSNVWL